MNTTRTKRSVDESTFRCIPTNQPATAQTKEQKPTVKTTKNSSYGDQSTSNDKKALVQSQPKTNTSQKNKAYQPSYVTTLASDAKQYTLDTPEKLLNDPIMGPFLKKLGIKNLDSLKGKLGKTKNITEAFIALNTVRGSLLKGHMKTAVSNTFKALGSIMALLPDSNPLNAKFNQLTKGALKKLMREPALDDDIKLLIAVTGKAAPGGVAKMVGQMVALNMGELVKEATTIAKSVYDSPQISTTDKFKTMSAIINILIHNLPPKVKAKVVAKMIAKKVPIISIGMALPDAIQALKSGYTCLFTWDAKACSMMRSSFVKAVGSAAGTIPGWGTAISILVDLYKLPQDLKKHTSLLAKKLNEPMQLLGRLGNVMGQ